MLEHVSDCIAKAVKSGGLVLHAPDLDADQIPERCLWIATGPNGIISSDTLGQQAHAVRAALRRFVLGGAAGKIAFITQNATKGSGESGGDMKELKGDGANFIEFRFKPPKLEFRLFGTFVGLDNLIITSCGAKTPDNAATGFPSLSVPVHRRKADEMFKMYGLNRADFMTPASELITHVRFIR